VFLHAFPLSSRMWEGQASHFFNTHLVIAPDLPGFGKSPRFPDGFTMAKAAQVVHETLEELKVKEPITLCGLSMGGYIAFEYVRAYPTEVKKLVLVATKAGADNDEGKAGRFKTIESIQQHGMRPFVEMFSTKALGDVTIAGRSEVVTRLKDMISSSESQSTIEALKGLADRRDSVSLLPEITCPTLVIAGQDDKLIPVTEHEIMQKGISGARLEVVVQSGHMVNLEQPEKFNSLLEKFS